MRITINEINNYYSKLCKNVDYIKKYYFITIYWDMLFFTISNNIISINTISMPKIVYVELKSDENKNYCVIIKRDSNLKSIDIYNFFFNRYEKFFILYLDADGSINSENSINSNVKIYSIWEYLYKYKNLSTLKGKKLQKRRNQYNYFKNNYANNSKIQLSTDIEYDLNIKYYEEINTIIKNLGMNESENIMFYKYIFNIVKFKIFNINSYILLLNNKFIGFCTLYKMDENNIIIISLNCEKKYKGSYQYLMVEVLKIYKTCENVYLMDDNSMHNLRKMKMQYKPYKIIKKIAIETINT